MPTNRVNAVFFMSNFIKIFVVYVVVLYVIIKYEIILWQKIKGPNLLHPTRSQEWEKTTTKNIARIGKHSELLKITDDPLAYAKELVKKYNEEAKKNNQVSLEIKIDFAEKIKASGALVVERLFINDRD